MSVKKTFPLLLLLPVLLALAVLLVYNQQRSPLDSASTKYSDFSIAPGESLDSIGQDLVDKGLVRSVMGFKIQVMLSGLATKIQAGDFSLSPRLSLPEIVKALTVARTDRRVTLLEGWRREEIALELKTRLESNNPESRFNPEDFVAKSATVEGKLFPDTYFVPKNFTTTQTIAWLTKTFAEKTADLENRSGLSDSQALVLASIVEREARALAERPIVAGILLKRLEAGWPLQADATIQYFKATKTCRQLDCDWWPNNLTRTDLEIASPYNTYKQAGLPPAPIANPSLASIRAAYQPQASVYWFYLHDSDGRIHYATTIEEHNQNIAKYLSK